jgi:membrane peptidoglycan carboxypeptidase
MGKGPNGWMTGFHKASRTIYGQQPHEIEDKQFLSLVAVLIAPAKYNLGKEDVALQQRIDRISRLLSGECSPQDNSDVWLEACAK